MRIDPIWDHFVSEAFPFLGSVPPRPMNPSSFLLARPEPMPNMSESMAREPQRKRGGRSGPGLVQSGSQTIPHPALAPATALFPLPCLLLGAEPIGRISRTSIPRDLSRTQRISLGLEARRCPPWHRTTTTETTKDPYQCHPPPLPPRAKHSIAKGKVAVVPDRKFPTPPRSRRRYSRCWNVAST